MSDEQGSRTGSMFGPYQLKRVLGRGGMGEVYEAEHTVKGWTVAVKLMSESLSKDPIFRERMKREARHTGRLQEPHVVPIHDYGEIDGQMYLEMRLIEGTDLETMLKESGPLTAPRAVAIITQIASALDAAHAAGVMHRDVKPPNILITRDDFAYLVDFGIASANTDEKLTQLGTAVGTWKYMAPERFSTGEVTHRADIYALACVLYEALTGAPPYASDSAGVLVTSHMMDPIPLPSAKRSGIPRSLDEVIARGMAKRPEDRYATAGALARAAHEALTNNQREQTVGILRHSSESTLPHLAVTPQPVKIAPPRHGGTGGSGRTPPPTPTGRSNWTPTGGPPPAAPSRPGPVHPTGGSWGGPPSGPPPGTRSGSQVSPAPGPPPGPPPQFTGAAQWSQPQPQRSRNQLPIIVGIAVAVVVLVIGAIVVALNMGGSDDRHNAEETTTTSTFPTSTRTTIPTTTRTTIPTTSVSADLQRLLRALPGGYPTGTCTPDSQPMPGAMVSVKCGVNTDPSGPTVAAYGLFPSVKAVQDAFSSFTKTFTIQTCPGGKASPGNWWHTQDPNTVLGQIACGVYKGNEPQVMWSNQQTMVFALVGGKLQGPNLDQLYKWWASHS